MKQADSLNVRMSLYYDSVYSGFLDIVSPNEMLAVSSPLG